MPAIRNSSVDSVLSNATEQIERCCEKCGLDQLGQLVSDESAYDGSGDSAEGTSISARGVPTYGSFKVLFDHQIVVAADQFREKLPSWRASLKPVAFLAAGRAPQSRRRRSRGPPA
jgi:hypothetical protein